MTDPAPKEKPSGSRMLMQYAGLAAQLAAGLLFTVWLGHLADKWLQWTIPVFIWLLPLLLLIGMMIKAIRDTSKK
jgi:F0F1-type ATP synthase assembly protein I